MFIEKQLHPTIEFDVESGQQAPNLVHYFSDRADPLKTVLPLLIAGAGQPDERVLVVSSPLNEVLDWTIELHRHPDIPDRIVVDEKQRALFDAVKRSLMQLVAKVDQIEFAALDEAEDEHSQR